MELWDRITHPITLGQTVWQWDEDSFRQRTYGDIVTEARHVADALRRQGVGPGSVVAAVITNGPDAVAGMMGVWFAGATLASLPIIARGMTIPNYVAQLKRLCLLLEADCLLAEERFLVFMTSDIDLGVDVLGYRSLIDTPSPGDIEPPSADDTLYIQFSSGTTGEPRGVELTGAAIDTHLRALSDHVAIDPERDIGYTWLPLSHDMGFFGCGMLGWYNGIVGVIATPERFLRSPATWLDDCAEFGATVTAGPPTALDIAARVERIRSSGTSLSLRLCLVGAEQIMWESLTDAAVAFAPRGLSLRAFTPAYGLAEATLAVTVEDLHAEPSFVDVDAAALADGCVREVEANEPTARRLVCAGSPLPGVGVRIDPATSEVIISSPSLASGYFGNPALTEERFVEHELRTGDIGFTREGKLFISGRADDLLVVAGRNIFVHDLERAVGSDPDVRKGNCAIVDTARDGRMRITLLAEVANDGIDIAALAHRLRRTTMEHGGLSIQECVFVAPGVFPKTPSGKVQRYRCREVVLDDPEIGTRVMLGAGSKSK